MGGDVASADAERKADSRPRPPEEKPAGTAAAPAAPSGGLGARQVQAKAADRSPVGAADAPAERAADAAAERVLRMTERGPAAPASEMAAATPSGGGAAPAAPDGVAAAAPSSAAAPPVRRSADPAAEQRLPVAPTATSVTPGGAGPVRGGPDTTTPAGVPAPSPTAQESTTPTTSASTRPPPAVETGAPAPDAEPPAPEGEAPARDTPQVSEAVQQYLDASRGRGSPLPEALRTTFETAFHRPLDDVRIHDEGAADNAARDIDALAFTRGSDIYFRSGAYDPSSSEGKRLLAHELAHVVQQRPGINRKPSPGLGGAVIRRKEKKGKSDEPDVPDEQKGPAWTAPAAVQPAGTIDTNAQTMVLGDVVFPKWKADVVGTDFHRRRGKRPTTNQRQVWEDAVKDKVQTAVTDHLVKISGTAGGKPPFVAKSGTGEPWDYYIGSAEVIAERARRPLWNKVDGHFGRYDVDHRRDVQLFKDEDPVDAFDNIGNLWLFDSTRNRAAGSVMAEAMERRISDFMRNAGPYLKPRPRISTVLAKYDVTFKKATGQGAMAGPKDFWLESEIEDAAKLVAGLKPVEEKERATIGGKETELQIFNQAYGGRHKPLHRAADGTIASTGWQRAVKKGIDFEVTKVTFNPPGPQGSTGIVGSLTGKAFKGSNPLHENEFGVDLMGLPGLPYAAYVTKPSLQARPEFKGLSPVSFPQLEFDVVDGLVGRGSVLPTSKLLAGVDIGLVLAGGDIALEAFISAGDLSLPGPFQVTGGSLLLSVGTGGLAVAGRVDFEIEKLAKGFIAASAEAKTGGPHFSLEGELNFDTKMFTKAQLGLSYKDGKWGVRGELAVGPDKVKGIRSASAKVAVDDERVTADGEFETSLKGIEKGKLGFVYDPKKGMAITGEILLGKGIPGIKSGKLAATVEQRPDGWSLAGDVTAEPDVPGLTGTIGGSYADGAFDVAANLGYERGQAKGSVEVGLTNRTIDKDGKPTGPIAKDGALTAYGGGTVTLTITPWLVGTVGLRLTPKGEVEVTGKVALPSQFTVFDEKKVERKVLSIGIDIPILGVAVAGQRIGIFATIKGGLTVTAGFGPGQLRDVALEVAYNPSRPDDTTVKGTGSFVVPAHAGLRLQVDGGIGAGIPVVSATAGVSIYGEVGLAGQASAAAELNWSPRTGIVLDARGEIFVEPKFRFGIDAFVDVTADLWVTEIELYHHAWKLAAFEYGSNLRFGLAFPLHYESGKPFELSFDQIQWTYPQIDPGDLLSGLMKQLVG